jgi:hypothetical protein
MAKPSPARPAERLVLAEVTAKLAHDVGKYLTRVARNLDPSPSAPPPAPVLAMLRADLYGPASDPGKRPHTVFVRLRQLLPPSVGEPQLVRCAECFALLDTLEEPVAAGQASAVAQAVRAALTIDAELRALALAHQAGSRRPAPRGRR